MASESDSPIPCDDFLQFTKLLSIKRKADDRIRNQLNSLLPTASFVNKVDCKSKCRDFLVEMLSDHERRNAAIKHCVNKSASHLEELKEKYESTDAADRHSLSRSLRKQQLLLRQFQTELLEEEVIQTAALKVIYERCREHIQHPVFERFQ